MSYQVLARKWRPTNFDEVVGQEHVVRSLTHALDNDRLHHAMLFTGTRGVGKTTIARILAKALNCEQGVSSTPCGRCDACKAIDEGRFIDLIEVDAASRTKVDQTRELLDNVQYTPTRGRYKVYLIDEVHMLSDASFNALLKTLEEPPEHIKFLLATTDPQKLPVTVLSRCLQFNLKHLFPVQIRDQLTRVLDTEGIAHDPAALDMLARVADGSMRDALSLLDQAIAFGNGKVQEADVRQMLGNIEQRYIQALIEALLANDARTLFAAIDDAANRSPDFKAVLDDILATLYHLSLMQTAPDIVRERNLDVDWLEQTAAGIAADELQLLYQIALIGKRDLSLAPDARTGFEMVMLRMLAFRPADVAALSGGQNKHPATAAGKASSMAKNPGIKAPPSSSRQPPANRVQEPAPPKAVTRTKKDSSHRKANEPLCEQWLETVGNMSLFGITQQLALHAAPDSWDEKKLSLVVDKASEAIVSEERKRELARAVRAHLGSDITVTIRVDDPTAETPAQRKARLKAERQQQAEQAIDNDPIVEELVNTFDATVATSTITPINKSHGADQK